MGRHSTAITATVATLSLSPSRKRKRGDLHSAEIEVDVTAPEPPSKKALRKAKKGKVTPIPQNSEPTAIVSKSESDDEQKIDTTILKRSEYGIWIGNLPWTATKADLRNFLIKDTEIAENMITRLHMPTPSHDAGVASRRKVKPQNKGFAYVDLSTAEALAEALTLSERLLKGRRVLIKDSKCFEGRPEKLKEDAASTLNSTKPPSRRIFVGNLAFETSKEDLQEHFIRCGDVSDVHIATFEDTGKCKGYAWVEFVELEAGKAAMRGWVDFVQEAETGGGGEDQENTDVVAGETKPKKKSRPRKWWVNRLHGRPLRMEFAEDKAVRYKKRYGKDGTARKEDMTVVDPAPGSMAQPPDGYSTAGSQKSQERKLDGTVQRRVDARTIKPGAAHAAAPRLTGGIVESQGKKITFA